MIEKIYERVSVVAIYNRSVEKVTIHTIRWNGRDYHIKTVGYHHKNRQGRNIFHIFHVNNDELSFKLEFDTDRLTWHLLEVSDGFAN